MEIFQLSIVENLSRYQPWRLMDKFKKLI